MSLKFEREEGEIIGLLLFLSGPKKFDSIGVQLFLTRKRELPLEIAQLKDFQATRKQSCKWMHTGTKLLARFLQIFRFTSKNLANLSTHLQYSCKFFTSMHDSCKLFDSSSRLLARCIKKFSRQISLKESFKLCDSWPKGAIRERVRIFTAINVP